MAILTPRSRLPGLVSATEDYGTSSPPVQTPKQDHRRPLPTGDSKHATLPMVFASAAEQARNIHKQQQQQFSQPPYAPVTIVSEPDFQPLPIDMGAQQQFEEQAARHLHRARSAEPYVSTL
jgi:hypothetical protein